MMSKRIHRRGSPQRARHALMRWAALALALGLLTACGHKPEGPAPADPGVQETVERGPVRCTVTLDKKDVTIADRITLTLRIEASEDYEVRLPGFGDKLEQFGIVDYATTEPLLEGESTVAFERSYTLEPFLSGEYTIPEMSIGFWKKDGEKPGAHALNTPELRVTVRSLRPEDVADMKIHDIMPPVEIPRPRVPWIWTACAAACLILMVAAIIVLRRRRKQAMPAAATIPPDVLAFDWLRQLAEENLIEKGQIKAFYQRISNILRRYIELRFGLSAPEQTTEEFLDSLHSSQTLAPEFRPLLARFLQHCDMVKFAELQPAEADIQQTFDSCKSFISETRPTAEGGDDHAS